jgi:enoyl-CoA hydratase/carnithine racemase
MGVAFESGGAVGTITLDNPPANSYDIETVRELASAIAAANDADDVRVVVLRSASPKFFSAGADVKRFLANDADANMEMVRLAHEALASIARSPKLFVAWIAGHALGGGLEMALACDLRYAAEGSFRLGTPEVTLGLLPGNGGTQRLPRIIGLGRALDLILTGRMVEAREAHGMGLITEIHGRPLDRALEYAEALASFPQETMLADRRAAIAALGLPLDEGLAFEADPGDAVHAAAARGAARFAGGEGRGGAGAGV